MTDKYYITNRTGHQMLATIYDTDTGNNLVSFKLLPGTNEVDLKDLLKGMYIIHLEDDNHHVFYEQKIIKN